MQWSSKALHVSKCWFVSEMHGECQNEQRLRFEMYFLPAKTFRGPKTWRFTLSTSSLKKRNHAMGMNVITQLSNVAHMPVVMWVHLPTQILGEHRRFLHLAMRCRTAQRQHRVMETVSGGERQYVRLSPRPMGGGNTKHAHRRRSRNTTPHKPGPASKGGQCRCGGTLFSVHLPVRSALISMQGSSRSGGLEAGPPHTVCTKFEAVSVKPPKQIFPKRIRDFSGNYVLAISPKTPQVVKHITILSHNGVSLECIVILIFSVICFINVHCEFHIFLHQSRNQDAFA